MGAWDTHTVLNEVSQTYWSNNIGIEAGGQPIAQVALVTCTEAAKAHLCLRTDIYA